MRMCVSVCVGCVYVCEEGGQWRVLRQMLGLRSYVMRCAEILTD